MEKAYQSIKHNRVKCIREATIKNLLNALGALFILNLYRKGNMFNSIDLAYSRSFLEEVDSSLFFPKKEFVSFESPSGNIIGNYERCIYLEKISDYKYTKIIKDAQKSFQKIIKNPAYADEVEVFLSSNPHYLYVEK